MGEISSIFAKSGSIFLTSLKLELRGLNCERLKFMIPFKPAVNAVVVQVDYFSNELIETPKSYLSDVAGAECDK